VFVGRHPELRNVIPCIIEFALSLWSSRRIEGGGILDAHYNVSARLNVAKLN